MSDLDFLRILGSPKIPYRNYFLMSEDKGWEQTVNWCRLNHCNPGVRDSPVPESREVSGGLCTQGSRACPQVFLFSFSCELPPPSSFALLYPASRGDSCQQPKVIQKEERTSVYFHFGKICERTQTGQAKKKKKYSSLDRFPCPGVCYIVTSLIWVICSPVNREEVGPPG